MLPFASATRAATRLSADKPYLFIHRETPPPRVLSSRDMQLQPPFTAEGE